jgi:small subunit ribosomal protein S17
MAAKKTEKAKAQEATCADRNCPIHGTAKTRGRTFVGTVTSDKMSKTVVVSWSRRAFVKKYERYERKWSKINAHNPECMNAKKGDVVRIQETRPLSKTKHFAIIELLGRETKKEHVKAESIDEEDAREELARKHEEKQEKSE